MSQGGGQRSWGIQSRLFLVIVVLSAGLGVHWLLFAFVSISIGEGPQEPASTFDVRWVENSLEAREDGWADSALLFDAEPLFLPTEWNSASNVTAIARLRDATELFPPFPSRVGALEVSPMALADGGIDEFPLLSDDSKVFRLFMGGSPVVIDSPETAAVHLRISSIGGSGPPTEILETLTLDLSQIPPTLWSPLEYVLILDPAFGSEMPLKLSSSGSVDWDRLLTEAVLGSPLLEQLPYGYYRVFVAE